MKFIHLSDLHIGKTLKEYDLTCDIQHALKQVEDAVRREKPDGIIIAGDVYDRSSPSEAAIALFDDFLCRLSKSGNKIYMISGNHDSDERVAYCAPILENSGVCAAPKFDGNIKSYSLYDEYGEVKIHLLPFFTPTEARKIYDNEEIKNYNDAVSAAVKSIDIDKNIRNILVTHQFAAGASVCDSENKTVGGTENVDASVFTDFDYVALGHLHRPQCVSRETVRYCGTLLKFSLSEINDKKSITVVELAEKGHISVRTIPVAPQRDIEAYTMPYNGLMSREFYETLNRGNFFSFTLTDADEVPYALDKLREIYPHILEIKYKSNKAGQEEFLSCDKSALSPIELFSEFYKAVSGNDLTEKQRTICDEIIEEVWC